MASNDIFSALVEAIGVADNILQQNKNLTAQDRQKMTAIKNALLFWKGTAFGLRDYAIGGGTAATANDKK